MRLVDIRDVFLPLLPDATFHYEARGKANHYIVWAEDGQSGSLYADDKMLEQVTEGTVDLFTKVEFDPLFDQIQQAMNEAHISWRWESTQHEEETGYIHHEWVWEVDESVG